MPALEAAAPHAVPRVKPRLRGVSHELAAYATVPAVILLLRHAHSPTARLAATVYGLSLAALFGVSAIYHRVFWPLATRKVLGRVDHSAIFLLIAGTYTPIGLLLGPGLGHTTLGILWAGSLAGMVLVTVWEGLPKKLRSALYVLLGWVLVPAVPQIRAATGDVGLALLFGGGVLYTLGAIIYGARRPDPFPRTFGFHEIFHLLVVAAAGIHYVAVWDAISRLG
ncbi:MAG: hemolysin III family protein [Deltaproteobacteria bacterium]|nr:hemolysin III family protein [Deltaproteobacteria bacterium]